MDFNRLKTFLVVAETGNVTQAAKLLFRTQPAITQQMKLFQEELDLVLFEKRKARIYLTSKGKALYNFAKPRVRELEDMSLRLKDDAPNLEDAIRIGCVAPLTPLVIPEITASFARKYPKIQFHIQHYTCQQLEQALLDCDVDFGISSKILDDFHLEHSQLHLCSRLPIAAKDYYQRFPELSDPKTWPNHARILHSEIAEDWQPWLGTEHSAIVEALAQEPFATVQDPQTLHDLILRGAGIGLGFLPLAQPLLSTGQLVPLAPEKTKQPLTLALSRRKVRNPRWAHDLFFEHADQWSETF